MPSAIAMCTPANTSAEHHHDNNDHVEMAEHDAASSNMNLRPRIGSSAWPVTSRAAADIPINA